MDAYAHHGLDTLTQIQVYAGLQRALDYALKEQNAMSKLAAISDRIAAKKRAHDQKADEWAARLDGIDKREVEAFAIGDSVVSEREADLKQFEADLRQLSNLPLSSGQSANDSKEAAGPLAGGQSA